MIRTLLLTAALLLSAPFAASASDKAASLTSAQKASVAKVEKYLTGLTTIEADFVQIAPDGGLASGKFYLSRPGKMRWQYDPPTPILMVADGRSLIFYDYELDQTSYIPLRDTLAGFLARENVTFGDDVIVTDLHEGPGSLRLAMIQRDKPKDGELTLEFSTSPLQLRNMRVVDSVGQETIVSLNNARYGVPLGKELFVFENLKTAPRIGTGRRGTGVQR